MRRCLRVLLPVLLAGSAGCGGGEPPAQAPAVLRVEGARILGPDGRELRLRGVNRSGTEYACAQGWGIFDGPSDDASIDAIESWGVNAVRIPLNEHCWLGINGVRPAVGGRRYRAAITEYARRLQRRGIAVILELHAAGPGQRLASAHPAGFELVDLDHGPAFWRSVAATFRRDRLVLLDLQNEPRDVSWQCWRDGCQVAGYQAAGMQRLVDAARAGGFRGPLLLGGLSYARDLSGWLEHLPRDPLGGLVASVHIYDDVPCEQACREELVRIAARHPVIAGEIGERDCDHTFITPLMEFFDAHGIHYLGWAWNAGKGWTCRGGPSLIEAYDGTATPYGEGLRDRLRHLRR